MVKPVSCDILGPAGRLEMMCVVQADAPVVIICHPHPLHGGTMHNKVVSTVARAADAMGFSHVRFNYRGVGQSEGSYGDIDGEVADARAIWQWWHQHHVGKGVIVVGFSFGAYVAAHLAAHHQAMDLVCLSPPIARMPFSQLTALPHSRLLIQGDNDLVVDPQLSIDWGRQNGFECLVEPGVGHFYHGHLVSLKSLLVSHWSALV